LLKASARGSRRLFGRPSNCLALTPRSRHRTARFLRAPVEHRGDLSRTSDPGYKGWEWGGRRQWLLWSEEPKGTSPAGTPSASPCNGAAIFWSTARLFVRMLISISGRCWARGHYFAPDSRGSQAASLPPTKGGLLRVRRQRQDPGKIAIEGHLRIVPRLAAGFYTFRHLLVARGG
jgi:hypothetical protein